MQASINAGKRHHTLGLLVMAGLSLLVIVGCGKSTAVSPPVPAITGTPATTATSSATATPAATATAAPASTGTLYTSADGVYSLHYPTNWEKQSLPNSDTSGAIGLASPDGNEVLFVFPVTTHIAASDYPTVDQSFLSQAIGATNIGIASSTGTVTLPSGTWTTLDGGGTFSDTMYDFTQLALDHGSGTFFIYVLTPDTTASTNVTNYFAPMLNSFTFLK